MIFIYFDVVVHLRLKLHEFIKISTDRQNYTSSLAQIKIAWAH
jgi:hypothetical protein